MSATSASVRFRLSFGDAGDDAGGVACASVRLRVFGDGWGGSFAGADGRRLFAGGGVSGGV